MLQTIIALLIALGMITSQADFTLHEGSLLGV